jgi:hypothetical protein
LCLGRAIRKARESRLAVCVEAAGQFQLNQNDAIEVAARQVERVNSLALNL